MENRIDKVCLDFYGLPGCGKSTISHLLANELRKNFIVVEPSYDMDHGHSVVGRLLRKSFETILLLLRYPRSFYSLFSLIKGCGYSCLKKDFYINLLNISYKINSLKKQSAHYIIFDQGLWQSVVSLFYMKENKEDVIVAYNKLLSIVPNSVCYTNIYVQVDTDTAIKRMDNRKAAISRVQLLDEISRMKELQNQLTLMEDLPNPRLIVNSVQNDSSSCVKSILRMI